MRFNRASLTLALLAAVTAGALSLPVRRVTAAPEPSLVPTNWELNFKHGPIERLQIGKDGRQKTYWFMRYTVTNNTGKDILFTPDFQLMTDTGQVQDAYKDVPDEIITKIKDLYNNDLLASPNNIVGKLLQGEDNARDGVIVFGDVDTDSRNFKVFISGLSGETTEVKNPQTQKPVILQKTLILEYNVPGQAIGIEPRPEYKGAKWVMK
ncbi:MAG: hypothetical protein FWD61_02030 [Phycisphaerales bacterium]|nr:hypothetical protein [Phycisphaerales bacterium]